MYLIVTHSPPTGVHSIGDTQIHSAHNHITHNHVHTIISPTLFSCKPSPPVLQKDDTPLQLERSIWETLTPTSEKSYSWANRKGGEEGGGGGGGGGGG